MLYLVCLQFLIQKILAFLPIAHDIIHLYILFFARVTYSHILIHTLLCAKHTT
jgi:hypothetical protein